MDKKQMREAIKRELSSLEKLQYEQSCFNVSSRLYKLEEWQKAQVIAITVSASFEVDTWQIIRFAWMCGKTICVPKCNPATKEMEFYRVDNFTCLEKVYAGLYEPDPFKTALIDREKINLVVVPGLIFNKAGYRIGFGGGYYDRFLHTFYGKTVSLAFSFQIQEEIPVEQHDIPVQKIVTEREIINCLN